MSDDKNRASHPSFGAVLSNWRSYRGSFFSKLRMVTTNSITKLRTRKDCCGNLGQPGC